MSVPLVLVLYNQPLLPADHPEAAQEHVIVGIAKQLAEILERGGMPACQFALGADPAALWRQLRSHRPDVVLNLFEGHLDRPETETHVAGLLEWSGIAFTGCPSHAMSLARAKHRAKYLLKGAGLPTPDFVVVEALPVPRLALRWPVIVKPALQDASIGIDQGSVLREPNLLEERVASLLASYGPPVLIEEYIAGREIHIPLTELPELMALPVSEIVFSRPRPGYWPIYDYRSKWEDDTEEYEATPSRCPIDLSPALTDKLNALARSAYRLVGCRDYARVDFRVNEADEPFILEVNPNPDISVESEFFACLAAAGSNHAEFIVRLVRNALGRAAR